MRIKKILLVLQLIILTVIIFNGCENESTKRDMNFVYPLAVGNSWQYEMYVTFDFDSLATSNGFTDTTYYSTGLVEIITNEIIFDSINVYNLASTINESGNLFTGNEYYNNTENYLWSYGYINPSMITPKNNTNIAFIRFDNKIFNNVREIFSYIERGISGIEFSENDSIYYDPVKCLEYPLTEDNQWQYRSSNNPWRIDKTIVGLENVDVPAGQFYCWKIHWTYPESSWNEDMVFYDFISHEGLVKRFIETGNMACLDEDGNFIGYINSIEEKYLTDYQLNN